MIHILIKAMVQMLGIPPIFKNLHCLILRSAPRHQAFGEVEPA